VTVRTQEAVRLEDGQVKVTSSFLAAQIYFSLKCEYLTCAFLCDAKLQ